MARYELDFCLSLASVVLAIGFAASPPVLATVTLVVAVQVASPAEALVTGTPLEFDLGAAAGPARTLVLVATADGPITIEASSFDADVILVRLADDGSVLEAIDGGGVGWNARWVGSAAAGESLSLRVAFRGEAAGRVRVEATSGEPASLSDFAAAEATARWKFGCAQAAEKRRDIEAAAIYAHEAGELFYQLGLFSDAKLAYDFCLPLAEAMKHEQLLMLARGYLGAVAQHIGDLTMARERLVQAIDGAVAIKQGDFEMVCQSWLGEACLGLGDRAAARAAFDRALALARELGDAASEAGLLTQCAILAEREGERGKARDLHDQACRAAEAVGDPDRLSLALRGRAEFLERRGELDQAEADILVSVERATIPAVRAAALGVLGNVRYAQGRWAEAATQYERVRDAARELGDAGLETAATENLALIAYRTGDLEAASNRLTYLLKAYDAGQDPTARTRVRINLSVVHMEHGRLAEAGVLAREAAEIADQTGSDALSIWTLRQLALVEARDPSRLAAGAEHAARLLELCRTKGSQDELAAALSTAAWLEHLQGRGERAAELAAESLDVGRDSNPPLLAGVLSTQAEIALARGDLETARSALAASRELLAHLPRQGLTIEAASLARSSWSYAQFAELEQDLLALALAGKPDSEEREALIADGFRAGSQAQARALLEGIVEQRSGQRDPVIVALRRERQRLLADQEEALEALAAARRARSPDDDQQRLREHAAQLASKGEVLLAELRAQAPEEAALELPAYADPAALRRDLLAEGDTLVVYAEGQERLYAYVLTPDLIAWHDLGPREAVDALVRDFVGGISDPASLAAAPAVARAGGAVWEALLQPLLPAEGQGRLIVVPTPALAGLPVEALVTGGAAGAASFAELYYVIDRYEVSYAPSTSVLALLAEGAPRSGPSRMLVLADPLVPGETSASSSASIPREVPGLLSLARLPGTRAEALSIFGMLASLGGSVSAEQPSLAAEERGGHLASERADVFLGQEATVARLHDDPKRYAIIHLAAHGAVDASDPSRSGLQLSASGDDDGFLSVPEVLELDLDADLVVLSACDTARGAVRRGEGVQSVARAFMYAGARGVVATLWQVDDRETELAMRSFYAALQQQGLSAPSALRQARLALRNATARADGFVGTGRGKLLQGVAPRQPPADETRDLRGHPYFWAPFISIGPMR